MHHFSIAPFSYYMQMRYVTVLCKHSLYTDPGNVPYRQTPRLCITSLSSSTVIVRYYFSSHNKIKYLTMKVYFHVYNM